jgi:peptide chain release factor subunit 1
MEDDDAVQQWKIRRLIKSLDSAKGNGTSMISLIIPPKDKISRVSAMLVGECGTAVNIKSRVNRLSVMDAISSTQQRLKLYSKVPTNGLIIYCGAVLTDEGKQKRVNIDFEPFKPINTSLYLCDNKFHTESLTSLLDSSDKFGFIIMDGSGCLFGTLSGNVREVLNEISVSLPSKHGRGGQSALRFARLRMEKRHNYVRKVAEECTRIFITNDKPNVTGLILAGLADFKNDLNATLLDPRLQNIVLKVVDVSYGGTNGFNQAIELSSECLGGVKYVREQKLLSSFMKEISLDTGKFCFGVQETLSAIESGVVDTIICWENLAAVRYVTRDSSGDTVIKVLTTVKPEDFIGLEIVDACPLLEHLANTYKTIGAKLEIVTDRSQEGSQFCRGFGGIGGILRYKVDLDCSVADEEDDDFDLDDYM